MAKIRTLCLCNCTTHLVALSRNHMAVSPWSEVPGKGEKRPSFGDMQAPESPVLSLPSPLEIPAFLWCLGLCGLRLLTSQTTSHRSTCKRCWKSQPDHLVLTNAAATAKSFQSCPTLCDPIDGSPPGSIIPGILQARTLEWVAISFSNAWKWKVKVKPLSRVRPSATPWTAAFQAPPSIGFFRQEYWSGVPLPSPNLIIMKP